ncbi:hypothetical protein DPMN_005163 [Dreissena polymorpha]|uniref:Uncharacterized protein n=1 Tax=Dreissena polymorpha TaxID=45954 RepID=A0A9D4MSQ2_DREPO|nr:hypothetical protein DPMN_005163 [Dreissena polymorpha]
MSRYPYEKLHQQNVIQIDDQTVKAICNSDSDTVRSIIETLPMASIHIVEATEELGQGLAQKELREIRQKQRHDPLIDRWRKAVIDQKIPTKFNSKQDSIMRKQFKHFKIKRGIYF